MGALKKVTLDGTRSRLIGDSLVSIAGVMQGSDSRVQSLGTTEFASGIVIDVVGIPEFIKDEKVSEYSAYGITESGWYVFARVKAKEGMYVSGETDVEGADGYIAVNGEDHIDLAIKFEVAAVSKKVVVNWGSDTETLIFRAPDLATEGMDYRVTFYVYDIGKYATWEYVRATDTVFAAGKAYYEKQNGEYVAAHVTVGDAAPAAYYVQMLIYELTTDETFEDGVTYYTKDGDIYTVAEVEDGETVSAGTYYVQAIGYVQTEDETFVDGVTYYTKTGDEYTAAEAVAGEHIPAYYVHSKVTFEGMPHNVTYVCNTPIDCPVVFNLPEIEDDTHGVWFEIWFRHTGSYSSTLVVPEGVKVATEHTQPETAGFNAVGLHYSSIDGVKVWRFLNTHSTVPA